MPAKDLALALLVVAIWGFNFIVIKVGTAQFPPFFLTALRFALVAVMVVPFFPRIRWHHLKWMLVLSVTFGSLHFGLLFRGMAELDAATTAILIQLGVPFSTLLAVFFLKDRLGAWRVGGLGLAFAGAAVLAGQPHLPALLPFLLLLISAFAWAVSNLLIKKVEGMNPLAITGWVSLLTAPQALVWSLLFESGQREAMQTADLWGWGALLYVAFAASIVAYSLWYRLLSQHSINTLVPLTLLAPIIGMLAAVPFLGETLTWHNLAGAALTLSGVGLILWRNRLHHPQPDPLVPPRP